MKPSPQHKPDATPPSDPAAEDMRWMLRAKLGDLEAFEALVTRHFAPMRRFIQRSLGHLETAEDLTQEVFLRAFRARARYEPTAKVSTWLYTIAVNLVRTHARRLATGRLCPARGGDVPPELPSKRSCPSAALDEEERAGLVRQEIAALPDSHREPLILSFYQGLRYREIAEVLGCTENAVKIRLLRARQALHDRLAPKLAPDSVPPETET
ncbi:MAG: sigma-70 family RNA polymerase sigma factor [Planctomycetota bacterium]